MILFPTKLMKQNYSHNDRMQLILFVIIAYELSFAISLEDIMMQ